MSHFTVLVIGDDVEGKLAPYNEEKRVAPYKDYMSVEARERMAKHYGIKVEDTEALLSKMKDWCGREGGADEKGMYEVSTYNPESKWDWYQIGGRWAGSFVLKKGCKGASLDPSWGWEAEELKELMESGRTDQARYGDIDWGATLAPSEKQLQSYNDLWDWIEGKLSDKEAQDKRVFIFYKKEYYLNRYHSREEYIRRQCSFGTYAVITEDGLWHSPGEMGWWGLSSETDNQQEEWDNNYWDRFLKNLNPETLITVVDCHI